MEALHETFIRHRALEQSAAFCFHCFGSTHRLDIIVNVAFWFIPAMGLVVCVIYNCALQKSKGVWLPRTAVRTLVRLRFVSICVLDASRVSFPTKLLVS